MLATRGMNAIILFPHPSFSVSSKMPSTPSSPSLPFVSHQILKLFAWEPSFQAQVEDIRGEELKVMKKFAYLSSVSTFIFSCAPALVSPVKEPRKKRREAAGHGWSFLQISILLAGFTGHICSVCRGKPKQRVDRWEGFHFHLSFQHPPISPGHAAHAHRCYRASKGTTTTHATRTHTKPKRPLTCSFALQTSVSKKRLEKFLGGEDLDSDIVRHDHSFSTFTICIYTCSSAEQWGIFIGTCTVHNVLSVHLCSSARHCC